MCAKRALLRAARLVEPRVEQRDGRVGRRAVQRGLLRNVLLVVDASEAAARRDFPAPAGASFSPPSAHLRAPEGSCSRCMRADWRFTIVAPAAISGV
jgi:hypothetical protein